MPLDNTTTTVVTSTAMTAADMTFKYVQLRDKVEDIKKDHAKQLEPYTKVMEQLGGLLLAELDKTGLDSMRSEAGTVYRSTVTSASVKDWPATLEHIKAHELWDLLEARVSKLAVVAEIQEHGRPVPGVHLTQAIVLRVRRS